MTPARSLADLKKTLAVLLDNIMLRLGKLEAKVENIYNGTGGNLTNSTVTATPIATNSEKVNVAGGFDINLDCAVFWLPWQRNICLSGGNGFPSCFWVRGKSFSYPLWLSRSPSSRVPLPKESVFQSRKLHWSHTKVETNQKENDRI